MEPNTVIQRLKDRALSQRASKPGFECMQSGSTQLVLVDHCGCVCPNECALNEAEFCNQLSLTKEKNKQKKKGISLPSTAQAKSNCYTMKAAS